MRNGSITYCINNLYEIKKSCEKLVTETQCDIEIFRNEQQQLHKQIQGIFEENSLINSKLDVLKNAAIANEPLPIRTSGESRDDATREKLANEAFVNVKKQIDYFQTENKDLRSLNKTYQKTIENLENEIQNYRNQLYQPKSVCEIKHKYTTIIKILEGTIIQKDSELKQQSQTIESLFDQKQLLSDRIEKTENLLREKIAELEKCGEQTETISKLQGQLSESEKNNKELQTSLKISKQAIEKRFKREQSSLQKVQEALNIAEAAVADRDEAVRRERIVKEECDNIASTIGHVMDEAARKVESDMEAIKNKYIEKEKVLNDEKNMLSQEIQNQKKLNQILCTRCKRFEQKIEDIKKDNDNLSEQLEHAAKALRHLEEINKKFGHEIHEKQQQSSIDEDNKIQQFFKSSRLNRERYNATINELTEKFQKKISDLEEQVNRLQAENQKFKQGKIYVDKM